MLALFVESIAGALLVALALHRLTNLAAGALALVVS